MTLNSWRDQAACAEIGPELFDTDTYPNPRAAINICNTCPVQQECLKYAQSIQATTGVWGGKQFTWLKPRGKTVTPRKTQRKDRP